MDDTASRSAVSPAEPRGEVGRMRRSGKQHDSSFIGSASGIHFVQSVYASLGKTTATPGNSHTSDDHDVVPGEEDRQLPSGGYRDGDRLWTPIEIATSSPHADDRVTFDDLLSWSQNFFDYWHPALPFLHAPSFLEWSEKLAQYPLTELDRHVNANQKAIIRSIMSISLADSRQGGGARVGSKVPSVLVFEAFSDALDAIQPLLIATPTMESLQTAVSVQLFLVSMLRHNAASRLGGIIVRAAFQMGLHRCPERFATFSREECDMRRRLFWSVYCLDRYICQSLGSPITLCDTDVDVCYPNEERHLTDHRAHTVVDERLVFLSLLSKHAHIKGIILELYNKSISHRHASTDEVSMAHLKIAKWANEVAFAFETNSSEDSSLTHLHQSILSVLHHESLIALNRPLLTAAKGSSEYETSLQACISSSKSVIQSLATQVDLHELSPDVVPPLVWPSFTWATWMSAFIIIYAGIEKEMPLAASLSLATKAIRVLKHLGTRGTMWPEASARVVQDLIDRLTTDKPSSNYDLRTDVQGQNAGEQNLPSTFTGVTSVSRPEEIWNNVTSNHWPGQYSTAGVLQAGNTMQTDVHGNGDIDLFQGFEIPFWIGDDNANFWTT